MQTLMNQSNVCNQHTLSCIYQRPDQIRVYKPNHYSAHHKLRYKLHEEISAQPHQLPPRNPLVKPD